VVNIDAVEGTGLRELCHVAKNAEEFKGVISNLYERPFTFMDLQFRRENLLSQYDNRQTAGRLIAQIW
jgi:hypothetical protein